MWEYNVRLYTARCRLAEYGTREGSKTCSDFLLKKNYIALYLINDDKKEVSIMRIFCATREIMII